MKIHPTACVEKGAELGEGVEVGPFAFIAAGAAIGDGCSIGPHVVMHPYTTLGRSCKVHAGSVIGDVPQDLSFEPRESYVRVGKECTLREGVTIHRGTKEGTATEIGDGCYLMAFSHLAHNVRLGSKVILVNQVLLAGYVEVGDGAFFGGQVGVHQFVRIGRLAMLGGACSLSQDVPPFCMTRPAVLNTVVGLNAIGMRRAGMGPEERAEVRKAFDLLYRNGRTTSEAVAAIREAHPQGPGNEMAEFVAASERGICSM